jgi:hypothetical protein
MGVYFIIDAAMVLPSALVEYRISSQHIDEGRIRTFMYLLTQIIEVVFGGLLIAKPGKWAKAIRSIGQI